jgi:hypothetical protein
MKLSFHFLLLVLFIVFCSGKPYSGLWPANGTSVSLVTCEPTLAADAKMAFGQNELIVPDAICMQSYMVVGKTKGLIGEWSIKTKRKPADPSDPHNSVQPENSSYIEYITYKQIN